MSHSARVRGLKSHTASPCLVTQNNSHPYGALIEAPETMPVPIYWVVASSVDAWIEVSPTVLKQSGFIAFLVDAWIKVSLSESKLSCGMNASYADAWIEVC